jgi:putative FmdB family regulatory protein
MAMPTYQYRCTNCGDELEAVQKFTDPALTDCPACAGALRRVYNAVGVVFKGSGFYRTDSRKADGRASENGSSSVEGKVDAGATKGDGAGDKAGAAKPSEGTKTAEAKSADTSNGARSNGSRPAVPAGSGGSSTGS